MIVRFLLILGIVLVVTALLWPYLARLGLGRLPGDVVVERRNGSVHIPIMTSLLISVALSMILSAVLWWGGR